VFFFIRLKIVGTRKILPRKPFVCHVTYIKPRKRKH